MVSAMGKTGSSVSALLLGLLVVAGAPATEPGGGRPVSHLRQGAFLFSVPALRDPNFSETVILLVSHGPGGAMGVIINRPTKISIGQVLHDVEGLEELPMAVYFGGPVSRNQLSILWRSEGPPQEAVTVFDDIQFTGNRDALLKVLQHADPDTQVRVYAGYAGWGSGQLEREVFRGDWVVANADRYMIFSDDPSEVWPEIFRLHDKMEVRGPHPHREPGRGIPIGY